MSHPIRLPRAARAFALSLSLLIAVTAACSKEPPPPAAKTEPAAAAGHAATGVKPGSHDDWCGEHGVPESQCTRCNPALIPAFQATNDWCAEHGLPESQCTICNPQLVIQRPPKGS